MKTVAQRLEMEFKEQDAQGFRTLLVDFTFFKKHKGVANSILKKIEFPDETFYVFDFYYSKLTLYDTITTVFFIHSKKLYLPDFYLRPETFFHKIAEYFGVKDIDFDDFPDFSANYFLNSTNEELLREKFCEKVVQSFRIEKDWFMEGVGYNFILYKKDNCLPPKLVEKLFKKGERLYKHFLQNSQKLSKNDDG